MKIGAFTKRLRKYVDGDRNSWFEYFILIVIIINLITLGLGTLMLDYSSQKILNMIDQICLLVFIIELLVKFVAYNRYFFKYGWNIFDLVIVLVALLATIPSIKALKAFNFFRSVRVIKVLSSFRAIKAAKFIGELKSLQLILRAMILSCKGITWTLFLLLIVYYIYGIIGHSLFGARFPIFFGTLGKSLLSLFQIMTFDSWCSQIARPVITSFGFAWIFFISFAFISSFVIMNIIVGIIVTAVEYIVREESGKGSSETVTINELSNQLADMQKQISELNQKLSEKGSK